MVTQFFQRLVKPPRSRPGKVCPTCGVPVGAWTDGAPAATAARSWLGSSVTAKAI